MHPSLDQKVSSRVSVAFEFVSYAALILAVTLFLLIITGGITLIITPELDVHPWEVIKR